MNTRLQEYLGKTLTRIKVFFEQHGVARCHHLSHFELQYLPLETLNDAEAQRSFECK